MTDVLLDAGAVTRCRRRVHLEHDPQARDIELPPANPAVQQRIEDAAQFRRELIDELAAAHGAIPGGWVKVDPDAEPDGRIRQTQAALTSGALYISGGLLPTDRAGGRRGGAELLVRTRHGYVPVIIVRHKVTDPGEGASTTAVKDLDPDHAAADGERTVRSQPRDQFRLAHVRELLVAQGVAEPDRAIGGVIGMDADVVLWYDLDAPTFPGDRGAQAEYAARFADWLAVASAAAGGGEPLAAPSRIVACKHCPWWAVCEPALLDTRDVSLVVRGDDGVRLREAGVGTVDALAELDPSGAAPTPFTTMEFGDAVALARAWRAGLTVVRRVPEVDVPRADVEVDVDMESFADHGAYLWGTLLSGVDIGMRPGYRAFATWEPVPTEDEARSFAEFWRWFCDLRARATERGLTFRAYCYNAMAENRWLLGSAQRFAGLPGIPDLTEVESFVESDEWVDLFRTVSESFLCTQGKGLKVIARVAGFAWHDPDAGGEASMGWYRRAVGMDGEPPDRTQRERLLRYNADDVQATKVLREWMSSEAMAAIPYRYQRGADPEVSAAPSGGHRPAG